MHLLNSSFFTPEILRAYGFNFKKNKNQALIIPEAVMLAKHFESYNRIISGSAELVNSGAPSTKRLASTLLPRQAAYQGVTSSMWLRNRTAKTFTMFSFSTGFVQLSTSWLIKLIKTL